ncbi:unnamed protein product [Effrenium voratum]|nr:unnamed protein product [Effrenium voratum]
MNFLKRIGDMLEVDEGEGAGQASNQPSLPSLEDMLTLPEDEAEKEAAAAAELLRKAAEASQALSRQLPEALQRARKAELEAQRLRTSLAEAEAKIAGLQAQQLRLADGLLGEIRQRDAELALLRVAAATVPEENREEAQEPEREVVTLNEGDVDFDRSSAAKVVATAGALNPGDEVVSVNGLSAKNMSWEELDAALAPRPVVLTVQRQRRGGLAGRVRSLSVWTRQAAKAAARELELAMAELPVDENMAYAQSKEDILREPTPRRETL